MKAAVPYLVLIPGLAFIVIGLTMIYAPAAWIFTGVAMVALPLVDLERSTGTTQDQD